MRAADEAVAQLARRDLRVLGKRTGEMLLICMLDIKEIFPGMKRHSLFYLDEFG